MSDSATDMASTIIPKSDQMNADDLLAGPRTITVTSVEIRPGTEQPVSIGFEGDRNKPFKPGKSMCRILVAAWGPDAKAYVGRSMTLYRDPGVKWGGLEVGGIRISHLSHIERDMVLALTVTKGNKKPHTVRRLEQRRAAQSDEETWPILAPSDHRVAAVPRSRWLAAVDRALGQLEGRPALIEWRSAMAPLVVSIAERDKEAAAEAERRIEARLASLTVEPEGANHDA